MEKALQAASGVAPPPGFVDDLCWRSYSRHALASQESDFGGAGRAATIAAPDGMPSQNHRPRQPQ